MSNARTWAMLYSGQLRRGSYTQRLTMWLPTLLKYGDVAFLFLQQFQPCHPDSCSNLINRPFSLFSCSVVSKSLRPRGLQASLSITNSRSLLKLMSTELVMPSNHLILCHFLLFLPSVFSRIRVFSSESVLGIRWPKY